MKFKISLLFIFLLGVCSISLGQGFSATGTVRDRKTNKPLVGAIVHIVSSDGSDLYTKTDTGGHYYFDSTKIKSNTSYIISASAQDMNYTGSPDKESINTKEVTNKVFTYDFNLSKYNPGCPRFPRINFAYHSTSLTQGIKDTVLIWLIKLLNDNPNIVIQIDAHASPDEGTSDVEMKLSIKRAEACKIYMVSNGIDSARVKTKGWGSTICLFGYSKSDIAKMKTKEEKIAACEADRRAEFRVLSFNYKPANK